MKKIMVLVGLVVGLSAYQTVADSENIVNALKQGNASQLSNYFDNFIDLKLPEKDEIKNVGRTQAGITVKSFFEDNNVKGFDLTSQREMGGTKYISGKLQGGTKDYNITLLMKVKADKLSIVTIRVN